jgi:TP901-1 family phage major tail protein
MGEQQAVTGVDFVIRAKVGSEMKTIAGGRNATLQLSTTRADATHKGSRGNEESVIARTSWSMSHEGLFLDGDEAFGALEDAWHNKTYVEVDFVFASGRTKTGLAIVDSIQLPTPENDVVTNTIELHGTGELETSEASS